MTEIFRRRKPDTGLAWTGERLVTGVEGQIEIEHLHRYLLARDLCRDKDVLDVASGEGYGTALLAQTARSAIGLEVDEASVVHASLAYEARNLRFMQGDATALPLADECVDVVVSFETFEHIDRQDVFLAELRRVMRPSGLLIMSTPDTDVYSGAGAVPNPFHVRELTLGEFSARVSEAFRNVRILKQRASGGSAIVPDSGNGAQSGLMVYEHRDELTFEGHSRLPRAPYLIAVASDGELPLFAVSLFIEREGLGNDKSVLLELERLRGVEQSARELGERYAKLLADHNATLEALHQAEPKLDACRTEDILKSGHDDVSGEPGVDTVAQDVADAKLRQEAVRMRQCELTIQRFELDVLYQARACQAALAECDLLRLQAAAEAAAHQTASAERDAAREECDLLRLQAAAEAAAHQAASAERDAAREEAAVYARAYDRVSRLLIPIWLRNLAPGGLKRSARRLVGGGQK